MTVFTYNATLLQYYVAISWTRTLQLCVIMPMCHCEVLQLEECPSDQCFHWHESGQTDAVPMGKCVGDGAAVLI